MESYGQSDLAGEASYWIGEAYFKTGDFASASNYYTISAEKYPSNKLADYALYSLGWAAEQQKDFQKAIGYYQRLLDEKKQSDLFSTAAVRIGECYSKSGQFQKSIDYLAAAKPSITDSTEKAAADYCVAEDYYNLQNFEKARALYEEFCKTYPLNPLVRTVTYSIGWTYLKTNEFAKAASVFGDLATGTDDVAYNSLFRKAQSVRFSGDTKKALEIFNQVVSSRPNGEYADNALYESGMIHYEQKDYDAAISFFDQVTKKYPSGDATPDAYRMLGESYIAKKAMMRQQRLSTQSKALLPANDSVKGDAAFQEGWALYKLQKFSDASAQFVSFLKEHPQHAKSTEALFWAGESYFQAGQFADAEKYYSQFIKQGTGQPKIPDAQYGLAWSFFKQGKYSDAAEIIRESVERRQLRSVCVRCGAAARRFILLSERICERGRRLPWGDSIVSLERWNRLCILSACAIRLQVGQTRSWRKGF